MAEPQYTAAEKARIALLVGRMAKRAVAGPDVDQADLLRRIDRIRDAAIERTEKGTS